MSTNRLSIMVLVTTLAAVTAQAGAAPRMAGVTLHTRQVQNVTVYYQPDLEPVMDAVAEAVVEGVGNLHATADRILLMRDRADAIVDDLNHIVSFNPLVDGQIDQHATLQRGLHPQPLPGRGDESMAVYVLLRGTIREYLRDGGELASFSHDPVSDRVTQRGRPRDGEPIIIAVAEEDPAEGIAVYFNAFDTALWAAPTLALRMTIGQTLQARVRADHFHTRWFFDGYADALTVHLLREHIGEDAATPMLDRAELERLAPLRDEANLLHWPTRPPALRLRTAGERRLEQARMRLAMHEALRLIERHGPEHVGRALDQLGGMGGSLPEQLLAALHAVTGEDVAGRLRDYQPFENAGEGIDLYQRTIRQAREQGDAVGELHARLRAYEISLQLSQAAVMRMSELVRELEGAATAYEPFDEAIAALVHRGVDDDWVLAMREAAIVTALQHREPALAQDHAEALLDDNPNHVPALSVTLMHAVPAGDIETSETISRRLIELTQPGTPGHQFAEEVLEQLQSSPSAD